jgi:hypothetical protein
MHTSCRFLIIALLASASSLADSGGVRLPTFGLYIVDETGSDVLSTISPELSRLNFVEALPRGVSSEHLPIVIFNRADDDELEAVVGRGCVLLEFNGAKVSPGTDPNAVVAWFKAVQDTLEQYLANLPRPHPRIQIGVPIPAGCPNEF